MWWCIKVTKEISSLSIESYYYTISEAAIAGIACGMSMNGKGNHEIMFGDFYL